MNYKDSLLAGETDSIRRPTPLPLGSRARSEVTGRKATLLTSSRRRRTADCLPLISFCQALLGAHGRFGRAARLLRVADPSHRRHGDDRAGEGDRRADVEGAVVTLDELARKCG